MLFYHKIVFWTNSGRKQTGSISAAFRETKTVPGSLQLFPVKLPADSSWYALFPHLLNSSQKKVRFSKNGQTQKKKPPQMIKSLPCWVSAVGLGAWQPHSPQQPTTPCAGEHWRAQSLLLTYSVMAFFSEKILRQKSASWCGSNVVGIRM